MIYQYLRKRASIVRGLWNTYRNIGHSYNANKWWDESFYTNGVSDRQTIGAQKNIVTAYYHYASVEMQILRHLRNNNIALNAKNILDIGSGSGHWIDFYLKFSPALIAGMDVSTASYEYLKNKYSSTGEVNIYPGNALKVIGKLSGQYDLVNAIGVMFHIVDDFEWENTICAISSILKENGMLVIGGHFGWQAHLNLRIDNDGNIHKRLRGRGCWNRVLRKAGFGKIQIYRNNAYLYINDTLPQNNVMVATKKSDHRL